MSEQWGAAGAAAEHDDMPDAEWDGEGDGETQNDGVPASRRFELQGDAAIREAKFDAAIELYTRAMRPPLEPYADATLSVKRSGAFASLASQLRAIPAQQSEEHPLFALDPLHLAKARPSEKHHALALRDAERACGLRGGRCAVCLHARGVAHFLLEQYPEAEAALLAGLSLEPTHPGLCSALADVARVLAEQDDDARGAAGGERRPARMSVGSASGAADEAECTLCMRLMYAPVTTPCGHSFCRGCLARALDHKNRCPLCRTVLCLAPAALQVSLTLAALLRLSYPEEYAKRQAEEEPESAGGAAGGAGPDAAGGDGSEAARAALLPLFVMDVVLPAQHMSLNVFEPRYRLMTRRAMAGSRRFGMCGVDAQHCLLPWCTEVEVTECEALPDGRFYLEVVGRRRCRIVSSEEQDGYRLARVEFDPPQPPQQQPQQQRTTPGRRNSLAGGASEGPPAEAAASQRVSVSPLPGMERAGGSAAAAAEEDGDGPEALAALAARADVLASSWIERLRSCGGVRHAEYLARAGARPTPRDAPALSWWIANLLPVPSGERYALLAAPSDAHRLRRELELMSADGGACAVM